ncbi:MAG: hypothetical protein QOE63_1369 [Acidimicrobiaceae bacterium]|jgi:phage tail-like protein
MSERSERSDSAAISTVPRARASTADPRSTWLLDQLPGCMAADLTLQRFVTIFQVLADDLCARIDGVEHAIDPGLAPPAFRPWLAGWLGLASFDRSTSSSLQRDVIEATGRSLRARGTAASLEALLVAITGGPVVVVDGGRVVRADASSTDAAKKPSRLVRVEVPSTGAMSERELVDFLRRELPAHAGLELFVDGRRAFPALRRAGARR